MENDPTTFRVFPWQTEALKILSKKTGLNASALMRVIVSKYIKESFNKPIPKDQEDILHFKARSLFERKKKALKK